ncbi:UNVERIFIED_CONTAM: putative galactinol--sucrose galactosyltransferase 1 [Sesamum angustifolium]|uniref:Galactinol--sucrose galactosyltransferase 1 n=1 Tax=Sesamum angustifolium TaxID=2727405 RepID=A0AAW2PC48_9LAMI
MARMVDGGSRPDLSLADGKLRVSGNCILSDVHDSIFLTPSETNQGTFIGVKGIKNFVSLSVQVVVDDPVYGDMWAGHTLRDSVFNGGRDFRAVLQGNAHDELEICLESGDPSVLQFEGRHLVYVAAGLDPYSVIEKSIKMLVDQSFPCSLGRTRI